MRVGCLKITKRQVIKKQSRNPRLSITAAPGREGRNPRLSVTAAPRCEGRNPRLSITAVSRREGRNPRLSVTAAPRREGRNPRLSITATPRREGQNPRLSRLSIKERGSTPASQPALQPQDAKAETRVSVITALIMRPVTAYITGKLTPHCGVFLGGTFAPETSINSPIAMKDTETYRDTKTETEGRREIKEKNLT